MSTHAVTPTPTSATTWTQRSALLFGVVFLIVGLAGFIPGLTTDMGSMSIAVNGSMALLLGLFQVSVLHNIVHVLFGIVGVLAFRESDPESRANRCFGKFLIAGSLMAQADPAVPCRVLIRP